MENISKALYDEFYDRGFIIIENLFSADEVQEILNCTQRVYDTAQTLKKTCMHNNSRFVFQNGNIQRVVWAGAQEDKILSVGSDKRITGVVSDLLNSKKLNQLINQLHFKMPGDGVAFAYHQDSENRGYGTDDWTDIDGKGSYVQTTLVLDEMTNENGPLNFLPYSGKNGHLSLNNKAEEKIDLSGLVTLELKPGSVAFFGPYTVHGSLPNNSDQSRRILINGYALPGANKKEYPGCGLGREITVD
jgi:ectoine hydroxylase-related dioxygenase (phytanoyl-CoA dioxygenase family)